MSLIKTKITYIGTNFWKIEVDTTPLRDEISLILRDLEGLQSQLDYLNARVGGVV